MSRKTVPAIVELEFILCDECGHLEERIMSIKERGEGELSPCASCGSLHVRVAILSAPATIYKGRGWFSKDGTYSKEDRAKGSKISRSDIENYDRAGIVTD